jgi:hypothetical protein
MRKFLYWISAFFVFFYAVNLHGQTTHSVATSPPLTGGLQGKSITFQIDATQNINITQLACRLFSGQQVIQVWYRYGGVLHPGAWMPDIDPIHGWVQVGFNIPMTGNSGLGPANIPIPNLNIPVNQGQSVGIYIGANPNFGIIVSSSSGAPQTDFSSPGLVLRAGNGFGFSESSVLWAGGRVFNGRVDYEIQQPCQNPPTAGVLRSSVPLACPNTPFTLSLDSVNPAAGQTVAWQQSANGSNWTLMPGFTNPSISLTQTTSTFYRAIVTCGASDTSSVVYLPSPLGPFIGTVTINTNLPPTALNYHSFEEFFIMLNCAGVSGPVTVEVDSASGPFFDQITIRPFPGASAVNTVTINGNGAIIEKVNPGNTRGAVFFDGVSHISISNFLIRNLQTSNAYGVELRNNAAFVGIHHCRIVMSPTASTNSVAGIVAATNPGNISTIGTAADHIAISDCEISGGFYGIFLHSAQWAPWPAGNKILRNKITNFYETGIYLGGQEQIEIISNDISRPNRNIMSTFNGIYATRATPGGVIQGNAIHNSSDADPLSLSPAYGINIGSGGGTAGAPLVISNNLIYNLNTNGVAYGLYLQSGTLVNFFHNTVLMNGPASNGANIRALFIQSTFGSFQIRNNIFAIQHPGTGIKHGVYLSSPNPSYTINHNLYHIDGGGSGNHVGHLQVSQTTLSDWQNGLGNFDGNSLFGNPAFVAPRNNNLTPVSHLGTQAGFNLTQFVAVDYYGATRSQTPDLGAINYSPVAADVVFEGAEVISGTCLSTNDTLVFHISHLVGDTMDFSVHPLIIAWNLSGPVNSSGMDTIQSGILSPNGTMAIVSGAADLSEPGHYTLAAYILPSPLNMAAENDTLSTMNVRVWPLLEVAPKRDTVYSIFDTVLIGARTPFLSQTEVFFSEICHFRTAIGAPPTGWPAFLVANAYVELTGQPGADLGGYIMEEWSESGLITTTTFPAGTVFSPSGTMVIAVGSMGASLPNPTFFYYHATPSSFFGVMQPVGRLIKDSQGKIVDAVGYGPFDFPSGSGVTPNHWKGPTPMSGLSGIRLEGPHTRDGRNWIQANLTHQNPNDLNQGVLLPNQAMAGHQFQWRLNQILIDTLLQTSVGPWAASGIYPYVATMNTPCGTLYDTAFIHVIVPFSCNPVNQLAVSSVDCESVSLSWTGSGTLGSRIVYGPQGFLPVSGIVVQNASPPYVLTGLTPGLDYEFRVFNSCASGFSIPQSVNAQTLSPPHADASYTIQTVDLQEAVVAFDASTSSSYQTIQWDFGGGQTATGVQVNHAFVTNQVHVVKAIAIGDCTPDTFSFPVTIQGIQLENLNSNNQIQFFPNPSNGLLQIVRSGRFSGSGKLSVFNSQGQMVYSTLVNSEDTEMNCQHLPAGHYIVVFENDVSVRYFRWNIIR